MALRATLSVEPSNFNCLLHGRFYTTNCPSAAPGSISWLNGAHRLGGYRNPLVMFGLGPAYQFFLRHRLPIGPIRGGWRAWISAMATNLAIAVAATALIWFIGIGPFLLVHRPIALLAGSVGVWLFYIQHQFEETFWAHGGEWNFHEASLRGSSHYDLPGISALVHGEHRRAPRPPSVQPHTLLRAAANASGQSRFA
jgi:acyl-lipid omega-6 desaturase (Delta-12 desaturase)